MTAQDSIRLTTMLRVLTTRYGPWAVLLEVTTTMRPIFQAQIEADKPPKRPRKAKPK